MSTRHIFGNHGRTNGGALHRSCGFIVYFSCVSLAGCHLFEELKIDCTAEMACAGLADDTALDTAGSLPRTGWIVSAATVEGNSTQDAWVKAYGPDGEPLPGKEWADVEEVIAEAGELSPYAGSVFYNPGTGAGLAGVGSTLAVLGSDGVATVSVLYAGEEIYDVDGVAGKAWYSTGDAVYAYPLGEATGHPISPAGVQRVYGIAVIGPNVVFTDSADSPDLYVYDTANDGRVSVSYDITDNGGRAANVFAGPDDGLYSCSDVGAIYRISDLDTSSAYLAALPDDLHDVTDCAWDPGDGSWLLFSQSTGLHRLTEDGAASIVWTPPTGYAGKRAGFFH